MTIQDRTRLTDLLYYFLRMDKQMNRTKRKIFEAAMELFAQKGYDGTSVEEITSVVGIAKGTLYYHFTSKEEIFYFLVEEGMKLLKNSIEIKTSKMPNTLDKIKAILLIQIKIIVKYENLITLLISQMWGSSSPIAIPVGIKALSPLFKVMGSSIQAYKSSPALPGVALVGSFAFSLTFFIFKISILINKFYIINNFVHFKKLCCHFCKI